MATIDEALILKSGSEEEQEEEGIGRALIKGKQEQRAALLTANHQDKGISATVQANGTIAITNVAPAQGGGVKVETMDRNVPVKEGTPTFNLFKQIEEISKVEDPETRFQGVLSLRSAAAKHMDGLKANVMNQAYAEYDVPALQQQLEESIAADKADPNYKLFLTDSKHTAQVRASLLTAKQQAEIVGEKMFQRNPEASAINDALTLFTNKEGLLYTQGVGREDKQKEVKENIMDNVTPGMRELVLASNPTIAATFDPNDPDQVFALSKQALLLNQQADFKEASAALASKNANSLTQLVAADNPYARGAVMKAQTDALAQGDPNNAQAKAQHQTDYIFNLTNNAQAFQAELDAPMNRLKKQQINNELALISAQLTGKEKDMKLKETRAFYAKDFLTQRVTEEFVGNVNALTWGSAYDAIVKDPVLSEAYTKVKTVASKGTNAPSVSIQAMLTELKGQPQAIKNLQTIAHAAYNTTNTGIFGRADALSLDSVFNRELARSMVKYMGIGADGLAEAEQTGNSLLDFGSTIARGNQQ